MKREDTVRRGAVAGTELPAAMEVAAGKYFRKARESDHAAKRRNRGRSNPWLERSVVQCVGTWSKSSRSRLTGVLAPLNDPDFFEQVFIDRGAIAWPGEIDLAPVRDNCGVVHGIRLDGASRLH